jgi:transposase
MAAPAGIGANVVESVDFDEEADAVVVSVQPRKQARQHCGRCGTRASLYEDWDGRRQKVQELGGRGVSLEAM